MSPRSPEQVEVHAAPASLRAWSPCLVLRRVEAAATSSTHVHANTFACLNVVVRGEVRVAGHRQPACFLAGPLARPRETASTGPLASASLVLQPWVLEPWFGVRPGQLADRLLAPGAAASALGAALAAACDDVQAVPSAWEALAVLSRRHAVKAPALALDALQARGVEAAAARLGCSARHYRRLFQRSFGLGPAAWLRVRRWEQAAQALLAEGGAHPALAALAADHGYADQAHLARDTQALVHASPARLRSAVARGDAGWSLAPARVRILQDREPDTP